MIYKLLAVLIICTVLSVGCSPLTALISTPTPVYYPDLFIWMERGPCGGGCPVYQLSIDADGNAIYEGVDFVEVKGRRIAKITPPQMEELIAAIKESQVFALYLGEHNTATGLPSVALSVTLNQQSRRLQNIGFRDCPGQWQPCELEHKIDVIVNSDQWVKPMSKPSGVPGASKPASDFGIVSQQPCGPPCFQGITPGVTTFADARLIMKNAREQCEEQTRRIEAGAPGTMSLRCKSGDAEISVVGQEHGKKTVMVEQIYLRPPVKFTVGEFIAQYGPPDLLLPGSAYGDGSGASMQLFYDRLRTLVALSVQPRQPYTITPDTTISAVFYYMDQGYWYRRLDGYLNKLWGYESDYSVTSRGRSWKGYGSYIPNTGRLPTLVPAPTLAAFPSPPLPTLTPLPSPAPTSTPPAIVGTGDLGIVSQKPYGPPCFLGIRPGVTTLDEAALILKNADVPYSVRDIPTAKGLNWWSGDTVFSVMSYNSGHTVDLISLRPPIEIPLGEFIARYGPPDSVVLAIGDSEAVLFYESLQTLVEFIVTGDSFTVTSDTTFNDVNYLSSARYHSLRSDWIHGTGNSLQPWKGYGTYAPNMKP